MDPLLKLTAWTIDLLLRSLTLATAAWLFLLSRTFRRQSFERWTR